MTKEEISEMAEDEFGLDVTVEVWGNTVYRVYARSGATRYGFEIYTSPDDDTNVLDEAKERLGTLRDAIDRERQRV